jgi:hypothetical protein
MRWICALAHNSVCAQAFVCRDVLTLAHLRCRLLFS